MKILDMLKETPEERFTGDIEMKTISSAKKICKFTKGKSRKYCRKKHNKHI